MYVFSFRLKKLLDERGLSQKWLADAADTKEATISRYITGTIKSPHPDILVNISRALNVSTDYLLGLSDVPQHKTDLSIEERILISAYRKTTERDAAVIWQLLDEYISVSERSIIQQREQFDKIG